MSSPAVQLRSRMPKIAEAAVERARLTVVPRRRTRTPRMPFVALVSMVLLGGVIGLLLFNTSMQQASFAATALEGQAETLQAREQTLQMELDELRNPQHIAEEAQGMGMVVGQPPLFLGADGKVIGGPQDGTALPPVERLRLFPKPAAKPGILNPTPIYVEATGHQTGNGASNQSGNRGDDTSAETAETGGAGGTHGNKPNRQQNRR